MKSIETNFFDGKCNTFIEGYRFVPMGETWTREDGITFTGEMISPWKNYSELDDAQRQYEKELLEQYKTELAELDAAMLEMQYQNLVEGL
jgi:hypothetical protein